MCARVQFWFLGSFCNKWLENDWRLRFLIIGHKKTKLFFIVRIKWWFKKLIQTSNRKWKWKSLSPVSLLYSPWNSPGQNTGVGSLYLLQGIFPTQGSNPVLPHCRWILYQLSHKGTPRILEWVLYLRVKEFSVVQIFI